MKRLIFIVLFPGLFLVFTSSPDNEVSVPASQEEHTILLKLVPGTLLEENYEQGVSGIEESNLRETLQKFAVTSLRSVFRNRYTEAGKLKEGIAWKKLLSGWFELTLTGKYGVDELTTQLKQLSVVIDAVTNAPIPLRPDIAPGWT